MRSNRDCCFKRFRRSDHRRQARSEPLAESIRHELNIGTKDPANVCAPHFIADFNGRFGKTPKSAFDAHRPLRADGRLINA
jgi:hypothetical protein